MPIYAYRCERCGHSQDAIQKFSDAPLTRCPACNEEALRKQLTAPAFQLKGSGWYVTDFRDNGKGKGGAETPAGAATAAGGDKAGGDSAASSGGASSGGASSGGASSGGASSGGASSGGASSGGASSGAAPSSSPSSALAAASAPKPGAATSGNAD